MSYRKIIFILCLGIFISTERNVNAQVVDTTATFNTNGSGATGSIQTFTVPFCASALTITANGAQGGATGGLGAQITGVFNYPVGTVFNILVGQKGGSSDNAHGSGGGGSFVVLASNDTILLIAGGGGGHGSSGMDATSNGSAGRNGQSPAGSGTAASGGGGGSSAGTSPGGSGCTAGATQFGFYWSSGGGGYCGNGGAYAGGGYAGGQSFLTGGTGGQAAPSGGNAPGGYGGGGGDGDRGAGGGGYSGGAGGTSNSTGGGGGGSYNSGTDQVNTAGVNSGDGSVTITWYSLNITATDTAVLMTNVSCFGASDGSAYARVTGVGLTYMWTPSGQTTDTASGLTAGTYTIAVNSPCGGSASSTVIITQPAVLTAATGVATVNVLCNGGANGVATVSPVGGGTPFVYSWTPSGQTTKAATGLSAGTYTVTVDDNCGKSATTTVTITQPNPLAVSASETANVNCYAGNNGSASSTVSSGTSPYTYSWSPSGGNLDTVVGLSAGTYTLHVKDNNGCTGSASITITQPAAVLTSTAYTTGNALCNGSSDGSAAASISGGTSPYTYSWTGGSTNATASGLSAGTYTMTVTDNHGCTSTASAIIKQPAPLHVVKDSTVDSGACTGTAWVIASGGVAPYTYAWSDGSTSYYIHYTCPSKLCCTVEDANGCTKEVCIHVISVLGVDNLNSDAGQITVYPNPNNGEFTIESTLASGGSSTVEVYNVLGEKVYTTTLNSNKGQNTTVNISNQPGGIYLYRVISNINGSLLGEGKIVLQK